MIKKLILTIALAIFITMPLKAYAQFTVPQGGTGLSAYTAGDIIYAASTNPIRFTKLPIGSNLFCLTSNGTAPIWAACSAGGGSSGGTWSTTTSSVSGQFINYPNNITDIVVIGSTATTSAKFYYDPNTSTFRLTGNATSTGVFNAGINVTAPFFNATGTVASLFPYASSTAISATSLIQSLNFLATGSTTLQNFTGANATTTNATTTSFAITNAPSALLLTDANGSVGKYAGVTCTNQFLRALSATGGSTCATVGSADVSLANLTATDASLTFSGTYNGSTARTVGLNLGNENVWTASTTFQLQTNMQQATTTLLSIGGINENPYNHASFTYATSTWTGTTTIPIEVGYGDTFDSVQCFTNAGTLNVDIYHGSSHMNLLNASTTIGTFGFTTNNTTALNSKVQVDIGTPASSPIKITCTLKKHDNNNN